MAKLDFNRVLRTALVVLSLGLVACLAIGVWQGSKTERLTLAAGASSGERFRNASQTPNSQSTGLISGGSVSPYRWDSYAVASSNATLHA